MVTVGTSWLSMGATARFLPATSNLGMQYLGNAVTSGLTGVANTAYGNATGLIGDEKSLTDSFVLSAGLGTAGKTFGQFKSNMLKNTYVKTYSETIGGRYEQLIPGIQPFIDEAQPREINFTSHNLLNQQSKNK